MSACNGVLVRVCFTVQVCRVALSKNKVGAMIRRQKRDVAVLLSPQEYDRLRAFNTAEFDRFCDRVAGKAAARGLNAAKLQRILADQ